ncbi:Ig-like domain-containing protein [Cryobacterium ruanii]|uniref:Ig-like domain-containing protein n=1 Tax=Cryobacterium ruanii TaxID=1259197 RepID=UPI00141B6D87|nr:Ig-like domain-containing protein [Cryobacterium ruanii]
MTETNFVADLAIAATGPVDARIELTEDNATSSTGGDPYDAKFSYADPAFPGTVDAQWGDTISIEAPAGFWLSGPEGRWTNPQADALLQTSVEGGDWFSLSPSISSDGSTARVTLPMAPSPPSPGNEDYWIDGVGDLTIKLSENETWSSSSVSANQSLSLPTPAVQGTEPEIEGVPAVGRTLTAIPGTWEEYAYLSYQWMRDGVPIDEYWDATTATHVVGTLDAGTRLTVSVTGSNATRIPTTLTSAPTALVPASVPGQMSTPSTVMASQSATVLWSLPYADGASPITGYRVRTYTAGGLIKTQTAPATARTAVVTGLIDGTAYSFDVAAINAIGAGPASGRSAETSYVADTTAPTVRTVIPVSGSSGATLDGNVRATFSEGVIGLTATSFVLKQGTTTVAGSVTLVGEALTFDPAASLLPDRTYTATIAGLKDPSGNTMVTKTWSFITGPAPVVTATSPASGATGASQTGDVSAVLSEPIVSFTAANFTLRQGTTSVAGAVSYDAATRTARFNPTSTLPADRPFTASVFGIKDAAGNLMSTKSWVFTTGPAPTVLSSTPESAARAVAQSTDVSAIFSEAITGLNSSTFTLRQGTTPVAAGVMYDPTTRTATLDPSEQLALDTSYTATLTRIKDAAGNVLADRVWTFTTGPQPTVTTVSPAAGATGVAPGTNTAPTPVTAAFSESVTGLSSTTFTLQRGSTSIAGAVTYNATTRVATLTPSSALLGATTYTATLTGGIADTAGNPLTVKTWSFTTGNVTSVPTVVSTNPTSTSTGVALGTSTARTPITVNFSEPVSGVSTSTFTVKQGTTAVAGAVTYNSTTRVATFTPAGPLLADRTYTASVTSGIKSASGGALAAAQSWSFITGPRPTITSKSPASVATGVSRTANVTATFSEAVTGLPTTAASTTVMTIKQTVSGTATAAVVSYNATTRVATLNPSSTLLANTQYTATITSGVRDVAGNRLSPVTWNFTTGS